ncbi:MULTISPECIES: FtsQ-type POTRA domain-containing protein [Spirulina sp. CCY15215]|uniref:cell division protein FtsQ/DivIB n=1 Tax=Spirulina sp. CCY15215 TaxID=2767591 RepID=UPI001EF170C5|nr:FtsQ-type POTRA domain-containing protein [Spirulina major]
MKAGSFKDMTDMSSVSPTDLQNRRAQLKRRRQIRFWQGMWRSLSIVGLTAMIVWGVSLPDWTIDTPERVKIKGNKLLSITAIRSLLPLSYPQSILEIEPEKLSRAIEAKAPIAKATVIRRLLPPSLTIEVTERNPVAIALPAFSSPNSNNPEVGIVDAQGFWIPKNSYADLENTLELPELIVIGLTEQFQPYWPEIYREVSRSGVKVFEIDLQSPNNLILKTELGNVHFGSYSSFHFRQQLLVLAKMRQLPDRIHTSQIDYIDLSNPDTPSVQLK